MGAHIVSGSMRYQCSQRNVGVLEQTRSLSLWRGVIYHRNLGRVGFMEMARRVSLRYGISLVDLLGKSPRRKFSWPRQHLMYLLHEEGYSLASIGRRLRMDHTTVMHGCRRHAERLKGA